LTNQTTQPTFEGVQLQDKGALLVVQDLHHEDVAPTLNLGVIPDVVIHSLVQFEAHKTWSYAMS
jgi:hypothetical protein